MRVPSSTLLLVVVSLVGSVNASGKSFLRQARQDEMTVGAIPKYTITHESVRAEEESYWSRLMQETTMSVAPTPAPPSPTPETPTPAPPSPTPESPTPRPPTAHACSHRAHACSRRAHACSRRAHAFPYCFNASTNSGCTPANGKSRGAH